jgi:hypothetical protein
MHCSPFYEWHAVCIGIFHQGIHNVVLMLQILYESIRMHSAFSINVLSCWQTRKTRLLHSFRFIALPHQLMIIQGSAGLYVLRLPDKFL